MIDHLAANLALRGQLLGTPGLPAARAWENIEYVPVPGTPYIEEDYEPATATLLGLTKGGTVEETGLYIVRWYGIANTGVQAIRAGCQAIAARFLPGTTLTATTGDTVRIRGDVAPFPSAVQPDGNGWAVCALTIPFRCYTLNPIT